MYNQRTFNFQRKLHNYDNLDDYKNSTNFLRLNKIKFGKVSNFKYDLSETYGSRLNQTLSSIIPKKNPIMMPITPE